MCHRYPRSPSSGTQMKLPVFKWLQKAGVLTSRVFDPDVTLLHSSCSHCLSWVFSKVWRLLHFLTSYSLSFSHFLAAHTLFSTFVRHTLFQTSLVAHSSCSCFQRRSVTHVAIPAVTLSCPRCLEQNSLAPAVRRPGSVFWSLQLPSQTSCALLLRRCTVLGVGAAPSGRAARCDPPLPSSSCSVLLP